jgi:hypothetical protein
MHQLHAVVHSWLDSGQDGRNVVRIGPASLECPAPPGLGTESGTNTDSRNIPATVAKRPRNP